MPMASTNRRCRLVVALLSLLPMAALALDPQPPHLVSVRWDTGEPSGGVCGEASFSTNNRFLAFACSADDLVPDDNNGRADSFVTDRNTNVISRVSVTSAGQGTPWGSNGGFVSDDGDEVAFVAFGPLHPEYGPPPLDDFGHAAIYLRQRQLGQTTIIGRDANRVALPGSALFYAVDFAAHDLLIAYGGDLRVGSYSNFIPAQIWLTNWMTGEVELISGTPANTLSVGASYSASRTRDGRYVTFVSMSDDLGPPARLGDQNLYLRDRSARTTERLTFPAAGGEFSEGLQVGPTPPRISQNGRWIVLSSNSTQLHPAITTQSGTHVYLLDRQTGSLEHLSATPGYASFNTNVDISDDERYVAWASRNFSFQGPANPSTDMRAIWVLDRQTGQRVNVAQPLGPLFNDNNITLDLSADGSVIAFSWRVANPSSPVFGRLLLYTVELNGPQPPAVVIPVPWMTSRGIALLVALMLLLSVVMLARSSRKSAGSL